MPIEIERKFLIKNDNWKSQVEKSVSIKQGYLSTDLERTTRIRILDEKAYLTVKGKSKGATRSEFEYEIPYNDALELLDLCKSKIIEKVRHYIVKEKHTWELDVFEGVHEGLVLAEIELNAEDEHFELPDWVGEEVTGDVKYYNSWLAKEH